MSHADKARGMSSPSCGFAHGLQRATEPRRLASTPGMSEGRCKYRSLLSAIGRLSGASSRGPAVPNKIAHTRATEKPFFFRHYCTLHRPFGLDLFGARAHPPEKNCSSVLYRCGVVRQRPKYRDFFCSGPRQLFSPVRADLESTLRANS